MDDIKALREAIEANTAAIERQTALLKDANQLQLQHENRRDDLLAAQTKLLMIIIMSQANIVGYDEQLAGVSQARKILESLNYDVRQINRILRCRCGL